MNSYKTVDEYINSFPQDVQKKMEELRGIIHKVEPDVEEAITYGIPTFKLNGKNMVHFGGYKTHVGFYPTPNGIEEFKKELAPYQSGKGTAQFPLNKPLPVDLITRIVRFRAGEIKA